MHLIVTFYCSPKKLQQIEEVVNRKMKYEFTGGTKGYARPFLSRGPFGTHDIRCKKEIAPLVLRDIEAMFTGRPKLWNKKPKKKEKDHGTLNFRERSMHFRVIEIGLWILRTITPLHSVEAEPGHNQYKDKMLGWHYCFFIGALKDPENEEGQEIL